MKNRIASLLSLVLLVVTAAPAWSQIEPIGPIALFPNQPFSGVFTNLIPPNPDYKELHFRGLATVPAGTTGMFSIDFDYVDLNGAVVVVPAPNPLIPVPGGGPVPFDSGILRLPFCPPLVSLHLKNLATAATIPIELQGLYRHQCFPVPEPASFALAAIGLGLLMIARRHSALTKTA